MKKLQFEVARVNRSGDVQEVQLRAYRSGKERETQPEGPAPPSWTIYMNGEDNHLNVEEGAILELSDTGRAVKTEDATVLAEVPVTSVPNLPADVKVKSKK